MWSHVFWLEVCSLCLSSSTQQSDPHHQTQPGILELESSTTGLWQSGEPSPAVAGLPVGGAGFAAGSA